MLGISGDKNIRNKLAGVSSNYDRCVVSTKDVFDETLPRSYN
jgi:hypothetical protein